MVTLNEEKPDGLSIATIICELYHFGVENV